MPILQLWADVRWAEDFAYNEYRTLFRPTRTATLTSEIHMILTEQNVRVDMTRVLLALSTAVFASMAGIASASTVGAVDAKIMAGDESSSKGKQRFTNWVSSLDIFESGFTVTRVGRLFRDGTKAGVSGDITVTFDNRRRTGSWSWDGSDAIAFVAYQGLNFFTAHHYDAAVGGNSFDAKDLGLVNQKGEGRKIRQVSLFQVLGTLKDVEVADDSFEPATVPVPASGLLLAGGLLLLLRRRLA